MEVTVNGRTVSIRPGARVVDVLAAVGVPSDRPGVAVALGDEVVPRREWGSREVAAGSRIEVVTATQGG